MPEYAEEEERPLGMLCRILLREAITTREKGKVKKK